MDNNTDNIENIKKIRPMGNVNEAVTNKNINRNFNFLQASVNSSKTVKSQINESIKGCINSLFESQAKRTPNNIAIEIGDQFLTYKELNQKANQFADHLKKRGVKTGDLIAVLLDRSIDFIISILGIIK